MAREWALPTVPTPGGDMVTEEGTLTPGQPLSGRQEGGNRPGTLAAWAEPGSGEKEGHWSGSGPARDLVSPVAGQQLGCSHPEGPPGATPFGWAEMPKVT